LPQHVADLEHRQHKLRLRGGVMRYSRSENARVHAMQQEVARAEGDYQRLRAAYLEIAKNEPGHEVALAMIGADMDRAHAHLQARGLPRLPFTHEPSTVVRREAQRITEDHD
jgi:hypothetical protein